MPVEGLLLCASEPSQPSRLPPSFWLLHCAKCSSTLLLSAQESPRPGQGTQATRGLQWESIDPGMPLGWTTLSIEQTGLIQSICPDPNLQDPGQPSGHCPTSRAPHATSSATIAPAPFVQGKGAVSLTSPWPTFWASPRDGSLWLTPRPGCCHLSHPTHCPP